MRGVPSSVEVVDPPRPVVRLRLLAVSLLLVVTAFHQSAGLIGNDTKLDLTADPGRFLRRALDLWNPSSAGGQLQNQAYGYLFPMGLFHWVGYELGIPGWVVQRLWMALLLVTAFLGVVRLAGRLSLGTHGTRMLGGLAYALAPRVLTEIGGNSSEILPFAVLPWVLLPLIGGEARPRKAAAQSGVAVLCMGAVNATAVLALLPLPALWLVPGLRRRSGRRLALWWAFCVGLATTWWFVPLLLQGRYSPDFLNYIETAATTTSTTSPGEVLRGTSHWLGYVSTGGGPWWRSGWTLVTSSVAILNTAVVAGLCLVGLVRRRMPAQGVLVTATAIGLLAMCAAHAGPLDGPAVHALRSLLDGSLAPFRNVHKFDALVRLPFALGLCHLLARLPTVELRRVLVGATAVALVGSSIPALAGQLVPTGGYEQLPAWWQQTGAWLDEHDASGRALVVPAAGFGEYQWGRPLDNPLQALAKTDWMVRDAVPLGSPGLTRLLDAVENRLGTGLGSQALAPVLARSGVRYLVVSNDLDPTRTGAPRPVLVHAALGGSPGLTRVASFGPRTGGQGTKRALVSDDGLDTAYPAVEVWAVAGAADQATSYPAAATWQLSGGPESLFQLADRGLLDGHATVLTGDGDAGPSPRSGISDALRRREVNFGAVRDNASATLTRDQALRREQAVPDILPVDGVQHLATVSYVGATSVTASSSASDAGAVFDHDPSHQPFSAFDGDDETSWVTGGFTGATGQWVQVDLADAVDATGLAVRFLRDKEVTGKVTSVTVTTDRGSRTTRTEGTERVQGLDVAPGPTKALRVTLDTVEGDGYAVLAGIRSLTVPGLTVQETLNLPDDQELSRDGTVLLDRAPTARRACVGSVCSPDLVRLGEDVVRLDRTIDLRQPGNLPITGAATSVPGAALNALLDAGSPIHVTASSVWTDDPRQRPGAVVDGDLTSTWMAGPDDKDPSLTLRLRGTESLDHLRLGTLLSAPAARPTTVEVTVGSVTARAAVQHDGTVAFPSSRGETVTIRFLSWEKRVSFGRDGSTHRMPVGVSEITIPSPTPQRILPSTPGSTTVRIPCGSGPPVVVDNQPYRTTVLGTRRDLLTGATMVLTLCDVVPALAAGPHRFAAAAQGGVQVQGLTLGSPLPSPSSTRPTTVDQWGTEHRLVTVGSGAQSLLVVHENANAGWRATLAGKALTATTVDGWQQAWFVPAGAGGQVHLDFTPGRTFHVALVVGGLLVLLLVGLALAPSTARPVSESRDLDLPRPVRVAVALGVMVLLGGVTGAVTFAIATVGVLVARREDLTTVVTLTLVVSAGLLTAYAPFAGSRPPGAFSTEVQLVVLMALSVAAAAVSARPSSSGASGPARAAPPAGG